MDTKVISAKADELAKKQKDLAAKTTAKVDEMAGKVGEVAAEKRDEIEAPRARASTA